MSATIFYSENGELSLPEEPRRDGSKYKPVALGEPLCVEICRVALGQTKDWMGDNEILCSSWAKTGGDARPAPRILNFYRDELKAFESISNLGAEKFGHNLIFYSPAYSGEVLRMTLEVLEIDQAGDEIVRFTEAAFLSAMRLPIFANHLPILGAMALAPKIVEIGIALYNLINKNDVLLHADFDLHFQRPFQTPLNPGRYVFVYESVNPAQFIKQYALGPANTLVEADGRDAGRKGGVEAPYAVIQVTTEPRKEYVRFQALSVQQEYLGEVLARLEPQKLQQIAGVLDKMSASATLWEVLGRAVAFDEALNEVSDSSLRSKLNKQFNSELDKLGEGKLQDALRRALKAGVEARSAQALLERAKEERKVGKGSGRAAKVSKVELIKQAVGGLASPFEISDVQAACPEVSLHHIRKALTRLRKQGFLQCEEGGPYAYWSLTPSVIRK